jgi:hypothetical protein
MSTTTYRQIICIGESSDGVNVSLTAVAWLVAPANMVVPLPNFTSRVPSSTSGTAPVSWGVTAAELAALQAGTIVEQQFTVTATVAALTGQSQTAQNAIMENLAIAKYAALQTALNNSASIVTTHFVGAYLAADGTTWTAGP